MGGNANPQMELGGGLTRMSQIDPGTLSGQERYAYNQAMAYQQMKKQGTSPQQALAPEAYDKYLKIMQQYFPNQTFYLR